jgi:hypothetical protein
MTPGIAIAAANAASSIFEMQAHRGDVAVIDRLDEEWRARSRGDRRSTVLLAGVDSCTCLHICSARVFARHTRNSKEDMKCSLCLKTRTWPNRCKSNARPRPMSTAVTLSTPDDREQRVEILRKEIPPHGEC